MSEFKGGCMCGAVQYAVKSKPRLSFYANAGSVNESPAQVIRPNLLHRQKTQYEWVRRNLAILINKPSAFFSVNLTARMPDKNRPETKPYIRKFLKNPLGGLLSWRSLPEKLTIQVVVS
ncbi:flavodoxin domain-containing protein [Methylomonas sp. TEB]|uniref:flavodoxin domain-containing protein n=1 Tax=Methylomonas sp. TEB TaxID=3398229 RepID=UPI0039F5A31E